MADVLHTKFVTEIVGAGECRLPSPRDALIRARCWAASSC